MLNVVSLSVAGAFYGKKKCSVKSMFYNSLYNRSATDFWIGQNDLQTENVWKYLNDSSNKCNRTVYLNWKSNQPNGGLRQNCMVYFYSDGGNFQDRSCDDTYYYMCKVKITAGNFQKEKENVRAHLWM